MRASRQDPDSATIAKGAARARAMLTMTQDVLRRFPRFAEPLDTGDRLHFLVATRQRPDGEIDGWCIGHSPNQRQLIWGMDFQYRLSADGAQVVHYRKQHREIRSFKSLGKTRGSSLVGMIFQDRHDEWEGVLPTTTDLLLMLFTSSVTGIAVIGPRYTVMVARGLIKGEEWYIRLFATGRMLREQPGPRVTP